MASRERLFTRVVFPHLLVVPVVAAYLYRDAARRDHPAPRRVALRYGLLGGPGVLLYHVRNGRSSGKKSNIDR